MRKPVLNIITLGCSKNKVDSEHLAALLEHKYLIRHDSERKSDVVIINTCGFIGDAQEESVDTILEYAELRKQGKINKLYVMGCLLWRGKRESRCRRPVEGRAAAAVLQPPCAFYSETLRLFEDFGRLQPPLRILCHSAHSWSTRFRPYGKLA